jgi:hypothetical protein
MPNKHSFDVDDYFLEFGLSSPQQKSTYEVVMLPMDLLVKVKELDLSKSNKHKCVQFLDLLITYSFMDDDNPCATSFVYFSSSHFRSRFNSRYRDWLKPMLDNKIIESDKSWSTSTGKSLHYRIYTHTEIDWSDLRKVNIKVKNRNYYEPKDIDYFKGLQRFNHSINIDFPRLYELTEIELSKEEDLKKRENKRVSWLRNLAKLEGWSLYAHRNSTNNRLDTNYTSFPKALLNEIKESNGLREIDAVNSQPAILANLIKDKVKDDYVQDAINGQLYDKVAKEMNWTREKTKHGIMVTFFSPENHSNKLKSALIKLYPETMKYIDDFKTQNGYKQLAISMQKKESELYIDGVLDKVYSLGITAISKHDSIIFHERDEVQVKKIIDEVLNTSGYELKIKVS